MNNEYRDMDAYNRECREVYLRVNAEERKAKWQLAGLYILASLAVYGLVHLLGING